MRVSTIIRDRRAAKRVTVRQLARLITKPDGKAVSPSYITDIEKGRGIPSDHIARELAKALGIRSSSLLMACREDREERE